MTRIVAMPNKCGVVALLAVLVSLLLLGKPLDLYFATSYDFNPSSSSSSILLQQCNGYGRVINLQ